MLASLLATLEPRRGQAWHGPTVKGALRGVTAAQACWAPAPGRHSIWQLVLHIAYWNYAVRRHLEPAVPRFPRSPANWPALPDRADERSWAQDRAILAREHAALVRAIKRLPANRWSRIPTKGKQWTSGEMIVGVVAHDVYHGGQISLLKRLWRARR
jgi:uncharacterized damage-inducible protein DinB